MIYHLWHRRYVWKGVNVANCRVKACARVVSGNGESNHWEKKSAWEEEPPQVVTAWWCCWQTLISLVLVMCPGRVGRGRRSYGGSWLQPANHSLGWCQKNLKIIIQPLTEGQFFNPVITFFTLGFLFALFLGGGSASASAESFNKKGDILLFVIYDMTGTTLVNKCKKVWWHQNVGITCWRGLSRGGRGGGGAVQGGESLVVIIILLLMI